MASFMELNHGRSCMQELDRFSHSMGWAFRDLDGEANRGMVLELASTRPIANENLCVDICSPQDERELSHTAFGTTVEIPSDFVAPANAASKKAKPRQKTTGGYTKIYRKRATRPTASSSAKTHPGDAGLAACSSKSTAKSPKRRTKRSSSKPDTPKEEPVDFVYDINVRRKLREQLDAERKRLLQEASAREARLRAENKWVFDKRDKSPPRRKQAWPSSCSPNKKPPSPSTTNPHVKRRTPHVNSKHTASSSKSVSSKHPSKSASSERAASSSSSNSSSSTSPSTCHSYTAATYQRYRSTLHPTDAMDDVEASIRDFERRLETHWSLHVDSP